MFDSEGGITQFLMKDKKEADIDPFSGEEPVNTSFKRPWFQSGGFKMDTRDRDNPSIARWNMVEKNFQIAGTRL